MNIPSPHRAPTDSSTRSVFLLYIVELPSLRAQSIQVVSSAHALARRGWRVRLWYRATGEDPLAGYGLQPHPNLELCPLPASRTLGSALFRADLVRWAAQNRGRGVFLARSKRYAALARHLAPSTPLVLEAHEVDSLQSTGSERSRAERLEATVLDHASGLVTNCEGVRRGLAWMHRLPAVQRVIHNAWNAAPPARNAGSGVALASSLLAEKDVHTVARAARVLRAETGPITVYGVPDSRFDALRTLSDGALVHGGPIAPADLASTLQKHELLVLPLGRGWFGEELTSPLKAFAYQNAGVPFVGADTPALRRAAGDAFEPYAPGDPQSLVRAVRALRRPEVRRRRLDAARVRTWDDRAAEVEEVLHAAG